VPRACIQTRGNRRSREIQRGLPMLFDSLVLCLSGGASLLHALREVAVQLRPSNPTLAAELRITAQQAELRSVEYSLRKFADRVQVQEVSSFVYVLVQSERLGTDAAAPLLEFATHHRTNMRQHAEAQAARTSFWMLFPTVLCLLTATAIMIVAPVGLQLFKESKAAFDYIQEAANQGKALKPQELRPVGGGGPPVPAVPVGPPNQAP
jgi:tight adherence protein C